MNRFILFLLLQCITYTVFSNIRIEYSINDSWKFRLGASQEGNEGWSIVSIPHTWNVEDAFDDKPGYYRGIGWYRKTVFIDDFMSKRPLYLFFEGVNQRTEVFVNKNKVGEHNGGYTHFCFEISKYIKKGNNDITVKVDNSHDRNIPPLSADYTFFGGIYRDVSLISTSEIHVSTTHYASSGVYIRTPEVSEEKALVEVVYMLTNTLSKQKKVIVKNDIFSSDGKCVSTKRDIVTVRPGENNKLKSELLLKKPLLWSVESPNLYRLQTSIYDTAGNLLDKIDNGFGVRKFRFSAKEGFILNDKPVKLVGTNRHQCFYNKGTALRDEMHIRDVELLHQMGGNFLRVAHYPQDKSVLASCDRKGIVTSVEIPIVNSITMSKEFSENCVEMMKEMIYQCYNSPSVCIWTYMNEVLLRPQYKNNSSVGKEEYLDYLKSIAQEIEKVTKDIDTERYTMLPCHFALPSYKEAGILELPDIIGVNLYHGWYRGELNDFETALDKIHKDYPDKPVIVSEYGADVDSRLHSSNPKPFDFTVDYGVMFHRHYLPEILKRKFVVASAVWNLNDFYSESRMDAIPHVNCKGLVTLDRVPKDTYRYYQAMLSRTPYISVSGQDWLNRAGVADSSGTYEYPVLVFTNLKEVTLFLNGKEIDTKSVENGAAEFIAPFIDGINLLEATGFYGDRQIKDFCKVKMTLVPEKITNKKSFKELNMLLGSERQFEDKDADLSWLPEKEYEKGSWGYIGGTPFVTKTKVRMQPYSSLDIWGTENDPMFQGQRRALKGFKADLPDGNYTLYLYWTEFAGAKSKASVYQLGNDVKNEDLSERVFHVDINGDRIISSLDVAKEVGLRRPMICKIPVTISDNKGLFIELVPVKGETMLTAVRIVRNY